MPPEAASNLPGRQPSAPVKEPFSCPKSSPSTSDWGIAPQSTGTNGPDARGLMRWIARATTSFPEPVSPVISTVKSVGATRRISVRTRCISALDPIVSRAKASVRTQGVTSLSDRASPLPAMPIGTPSAHHV